MKRSARPLATALLALVLGAFLLVPPASAQEEAAFTEGELARMLAPIALYPDALLSQILMASTYPLEVVEAARWSRDNPHLEGSDAVDAVEDMDWDPSVKSLVAFPRILARMNEDLAWTRNLGDAFLLQEEQVADVIQDLRQRAYEAGHLESSEHIRVVREPEVIYIESAHPRVVYVPYYRPTVVYGGWWWPAYAPVYWYPPAGYSLSIGITWVSGAPVSHSFFFSTFNWHTRHVVVIRHYDRHRHVGRVHHSKHRWRHDPWHRRGVAYRHKSVQERYTGRVHSDRREVTRSGTGSRFSGGPSSTSWRDGGTRQHADSRPRGSTSRDQWTSRSHSDTQTRSSRDARPAWQGERRHSGQVRREFSGSGRSITPDPGRSSPNFRDRSSYGQQAETAQRSLQQRREQMERQRRTHSVPAWQSQGAQRPETRGRQGTRGGEARGTRPDRGAVTERRGRIEHSRPSRSDNRPAARGGTDSGWQGRQRGGGYEGSRMQSRQDHGRTMRRGEERGRSFSR
ncbi:hypothetical protein B1C78_04210 [Thioalkalivibrio denitrificans]|uniref:DUF3300 domain-containing protein n=1 Tax=Thioalkalivibrio denitrificans TaxID=108003 RepID=A0A1V3NQ65_9GAMM|nr:DUF3300 domain-containing protein [Thioalkalivibrio denitrificans]OOG27190.1 hypothetical protein B1C78_04210 [Thioalkalivibrio denitrificans]